MSDNEIQSKYDNIYNAEKAKLNSQKASTGLQSSRDIQKSLASGRKQERMAKSRAATSSGVSGIGQKGIQNVQNQTIGDVANRIEDRSMNYTKIENEDKSIKASLDKEAQTEKEKERQRLYDMMVQQQEAEKNRALQRELAAASRASSSSGGGGSVKKIQPSKTPVINPKTGGVAYYKEVLPDGRVEFASYGKSGRKISSPLDVHKKTGIPITQL